MRAIEFAGLSAAKRHKANFTLKDSQSRSLAIAAKSRAGPPAARMERSEIRDCRDASMPPRI